ncbi:MAG: DUF4258 domain-containing protein [candidate division KSB1 bacterium]|nr:DUF4258 domain-containing protein [candidate division KSB1 bacterium]
MNLLDKIQNCFTQNRIYYSRHAKVEMENEEFGQIKEHEVFESILSGQIIESYPDDEPYPSVLIFGYSQQNRPLHCVCALNENDNWVIVITVYHPDPELWIDYRIRRK